MSTISGTPLPLRRAADELPIFDAMKLDVVYRNGCWHHHSLVAAPRLPRGVQRRYDLLRLRERLRKEAREGR